MLEVHSLYAGYDAKFYGANVDNIKKWKILMESKN